MYCSSMDSLNGSHVCYMSAASDKDTIYPGNADSKKKAAVQNALEYYFQVKLTHSCVWYLCLHSMAHQSDGPMQPL